MDRFTPLNTFQEQRLLEEDARNVNMEIKYSNVFPFWTVNIHTVLTLKKLISFTENLIMKYP